MKASKKLLSILLATMMVMGLAAPAQAENSSSSKVQITKTLHIGQGITVPTETFRFSAVPASLSEISEVGDTNGFIDPNATQHQITYPALNNNGSVASVAYQPNMRTASSTDTSMTFMTDEIDLAQINWPAAGLYIYKVTETPGSMSGMTYDNSVYFLKVYVKNSGSSNTVEAVTVYGKDESGNWVKKDGAPNDAKEPGTTEQQDGCDDFAGNEFLFNNSYSSLVEKHPINTNSTSGDTALPTDTDYSDWAFKLTKEVTGSYGNTSSAFDFAVTVSLPETFQDPNFQMTAVVNGYTANKLDASKDASDASVEVTFPRDGAAHTVYLKHGESFGIKKLPAGTIIHVDELARSGEKYLPSFTGKWGLDVSSEKQGSGAKGGNLESGTIVVGENGAYIQYVNTLNDTDVTATGIFINNLPAILMVSIALGGIGVLTMSKKRRRS